MKLSSIDTNFAIKTQIAKDDIKFYNADENPFKVYGVVKENGKYRRMPESDAIRIGGGVSALHTHTAGGRVRFITDSPYIAIHSEMENLCKMPHFAISGSVGFDLYEDNRYINTFIPPFDIQSGYEGIIELGSANERSITVNFPLYCGVTELYIGLKEGSIIKEPVPYKVEKPIVYYGSSITQGGCASRAGMSYQAIISRTVDCDFVNLGFSGSALAEDQMTEYIQNLDMSAFVMDYDHNAPSVEYLANTHEKMFKVIREVQPKLPIILMSRPKHNLTDVEKERRAVIEATYKNAVSRGDKNVYFLDNSALTALCGDSGTVDNCHPTDFGFASMAKALIDVIKEIGIF